MKKIFLLGILCLMIISMDVFGQTYGDVDGNGAVNIVDALMTAQFGVGISVPHFDEVAADVDAVNGVNILDALMIAQFDARIIDRFPAEHLQPTPPPVQGRENIINGDFSAGTTNWTGGFYAPGAGSMLVTSGELGLVISSGGTETWHVQLTQGGINLMSGTNYTFSFDAGSAAPRTIEANVGMSLAPYTSHFASGALGLTTDMTPYSFSFTALTSDSTARVEFNCGLNANDIYIDNVSLIGSSGSATPEPAIINFPDPHLEAAIRAEINKPVGSIYNTDVANIISINLNHKEISDLTGLEHLTGLRRLILSSNHSAFDLTPLADLTNLTELNLGANRLTDIAPLANLTNLTELNLVVNFISDLTPLANLTKLSFLRCEFNAIADLTPLVNLSSLAYLDLEKNKVIDLTPLANLSSLAYLNLVDNQITDVTALGSLTKMRELVLSGFPLTEITALGNLTELGTLVLNVKVLRDIAPLASLTRLVSLNIDNNQISDITPLANLATNLNVLSIVNNPLNGSARTVIDSLLAAGVWVVR